LMIKNFIESVERIKIPNSFHLKFLEFTFERPKDSEVFWSVLGYEIFSKDKTLYIAQQFPKDVVMKALKLEIESKLHEGCVKNQKFIAKSFEQMKEKFKNRIAFVKADSIITIFSNEKISLEEIDLLWKNSTGLMKKDIPCINIVEKLEEETDSTAMCFLNFEMLERRAYVSYYNWNKNITFSLIIFENPKILEFVDWEERNGIKMSNNIWRNSYLIDLRPTQLNSYPIFLALEKEKINDNTLKFLKELFYKLVKNLK